MTQKVSPRPPSCLDDERCPRVAGVLETSKGCVALGRIGSDRPFGVSREWLMRGVVASAVAALCLNGFACLAMSDAAGVVRASAWAVGRARGRASGTAYLGLTSTVAYHGGDRIYDERWASIDCDDYGVPPDDDARVKPRDDVRKCERCKRRVNSMRQTVVVSLITTFGTIRFASKRIRADADRNFFKFLGIGLGCVAFATAISALVPFRRHCTMSSTDTLRMRNGPGFICMSIAVCLKGASVVCHLVLRAPGGRSAVAGPSASASTEEASSGTSP